jgi:hypothetical protein
VEDPALKVELPIKFCKKKKKERLLYYGVGYVGCLVGYIYVYNRRFYDLISTKFTAVFEGKLPILTHMAALFSKLFHLKDKTAT